MQNITALLQGGYAYLLIFQIIVVSSLCVLLAAMILRRMRSETLPISGAVAKGAAGTSVELTELQIKYKVLETENTKLQTGKTDSVALQEKVKFLESKLLEYEILQEEIGALSSLKVENEKLRKEFTELQGELTNGVGERAVLSTSAITQVTSSSENSLYNDNEPQLTPSSEETVSLTGEVADKKVSEPSTAPAVEVSGPPNLDGLLAEIDALASPPPK